MNCLFHVKTEAQVIVNEALNVFAVHRRLGDWQNGYDGYSISFF